MTIAADPKQERKGQSVATGLSQERHSGQSTLQLVDNRPTVIVQRHLQQLANNSPRAIQLKAYQEMVNHSRQARPATRPRELAGRHAAQQPQPVQLEENTIGPPPDNYLGSSRPVIQIGATHNKTLNHTNEQAPSPSIAVPQRKAVSSSPVVQMVGTRITARFNPDPETHELQGILTGTLQSISGNDQDYFNSLPDDAPHAILTALNQLDPDALELGEQAYVDDIRQKARVAGRTHVEIDADDDSATATLGGRQLAEITYEQFDDGKYWIIGMDTEPDWRRLGIATNLLTEATDALGGILYVSNQGQNAHEDRDPNDTRWLTGEGAAFINAAIHAGLRVQYANPFAADYEMDSDYDDYYDDDYNDEV